MKDCQQCKDYRDCMGHAYIVEREGNKIYVPWYHYGEIRFCPYQVIWIIENLIVPEIGNWPPDPSGSSDSSIRGALSHHANFEATRIIAGELEWRLNKTGADGRALKHAIKAGDIEFDAECQCALYYVTGRSLLLNPDGSWKWKKMEYTNWRKQWRFRHGMTTKSLIS